MKRILRLFIVSLLFTFTIVRADSDPDSAYIEIYTKISEGDALLQNKDTNGAYSKYVAAQKELFAFDKNNRHWNDTIINYRQAYLQEKIAALSRGVTAAPAAKPASPKAAAAGAGKPENGILTLLSAGAEPRQMLRLHPHVGDKQSASMTMKMGMATESPGVPAQPMKMPAIVTPMDITIQTIAENGDITYEMIGGEPSVLPEPSALPGVADAMKAAVAGMKGMTTTATVSSRGITKGMNVNLPAGMAAQMRDSIEQMKDAMEKASNPFPEEAVGAGAKWEYKQRIKSQGMTMDQTTTYELVSAEGDALNLRCTITQGAASQVIENSSMPGIKVELTKLTGNGAGTLNRSLNQLMPVTGSIEEKIDLAMAVPMGQQKQPMSMNMDVNVTFESK